MADEQAPWETSASGETASGDTPPWETHPSLGDAILKTPTLPDMIVGGAHALVKGAAGQIGKGYGYLEESAARIAGNAEPALSPEERGEQAAGFIPDLPKGSRSQTAENILGAGMGKAGEAASAAGHWATEPTAEMKANPQKYGFKDAQEMQDSVTRERGIWVGLNEAAQTAGAVAAPLEAAGRIPGAVRSLRRPPAVAPEAAPVAPAPPAPRPGAITADDLRSSPERLTAPQEPTAAPGAPEAAAPATGTPGKLKVRLKSQAAPEAAPAPPVTSSPPPAAQTGRAAVLHQLNADSGGQLSEVRSSALTGEPGATAVDHAHSSIEDAPGQRMAGVINNEDKAIRTASQRIVDDTGSVTAGTGSEARQTRGGIIDHALTKVRDWFGDNVKKLYAGADAAAGGVPMTKFDNFQGLLGDPSKFTGAEGMQLHGDIQKMAQHFGLMGPDGFWKPTTAKNVEAFRQWVGEQYTPRTGKTIRAIKDALDDDVAAHGGADFYAKARALRAKQDAMLEGPKGISQLIPEKNPDGTNSINRPVPIANIADHVTNQLSKEQFDHIVNVLHDSAKLGDGELAESSAAALREIKAHMAERLHESGALKANGEPSGKWNTGKYHKQLDAFKLKMPGLFSKDEIQRVQTVHDAGNILHVNDSYPKAAELQRHLAAGEKSKMRENFGNAAAGELVNLVSFPGVATVAELTGLEQKLRDTFGGKGNVKKRALEVESRIQKLEEKAGGEPPAGGDSAPPAAPAGGSNTTPPAGRPGPVGPGRKQGGWIGTGPSVKKTDLPAITKHDHDPLTGQHYVYTKHGWTDAEDHANGKDIVVKQTQTKPEGQGKGEGTARMAHLADIAHERGGVLRSDAAVSPSQVKSYKALKSLGYDVKLNPNAERSVLNGRDGIGYLSDDIRKPVFTVGPKKQSLLDKFRGPGPESQETATNVPRGQAMGQRGAVGDIYDRTPQKDVWAPTRPVENRMPTKEQRTSNPYDSGGGRTMGDRVFGGKQRGGPKMSDFKRPKAEPAEEPGYRAPKELEDFIHKQAPDHVVDEKGPASWEELQARGKESPMPVNPQSAEHSIYSDTPTNIAFRAWHDKTHLDLGAGFDHEGELKVALEHQRQAKEAGMSEEGQRALWADTWETFKHHEDHGDFPAKPREFVADQMKNRFPGDDHQGATVNIGLHQGTEGQPGFRKMSKQEATAALKQSGANVTQSSLSTSGSEPTLVASLDRPLSREQMQGVMAKTKQSAIPQRFSNGAGEMHVAPGHEAAAAKQGWDKYDPEQFRMHDDRVATEHDAERDAYSKIAPHLTPSERDSIVNRSEKLRANAIKNVSDVFHGSTSVDGTAAMALAGQAKKGWYERSAHAIHTVFGTDSPRFTALLAAMSPQTSVEMNFHNALNTFKAWDEAGRPQDAAQIRKIMEKNSLRNPDSTSKSNVMEAWLQNGVRALTSENPEHESFALSGPKVDSFYQNLRNNTHEVTNDSWNAIAMNIDQTLFGGLTKKVVGDPYGKRGFKSPEYMGVSAKMRATAQRLEQMTGDKWDPREIQETVWSFVKTAMEYNKTAAKAARAAGQAVPPEKTIPQLIHEGLINDDLIRSTPDFHQLFSAPQHAATLASSKYAEGAGRLAAEQGNAPKPAAPSKASAAAAGHLRPALLEQAERLEGVRQQRIADKAAGRKERQLGNIKVPF